MQFLDLDLNLVSEIALPHEYSNAYIIALDEAFLYLQVPALEGESYNAIYRVNLEGLKSSKLEFEAFFVYQP